MNYDNEQMDPIVKIGMVNYINTAPIYEEWKETVTDERFRVIEEPPLVLNRLLAAGNIDLGFVSCYEYCARPERYRILEDLSISSIGAVGSVFLFSHVPLEQLDGCLVLLSNQSETSVCLVKIILEEFYAMKPQYVVGGVMGDMRRSCAAVLAIGDDALRLVSRKDYAYQFDLGEIWHAHTGLPFVFSVCVVRDHFARRNATLVEEVRQALVNCRDNGKKRLAAICEIVAPRIPMDFSRCHAYLEALEYDLDDKKCMALEKFFSMLMQRGEASRQAMPLKFFP